nr:DUF1772 domain-containing protein [uncultured Chloroflexus sp.]
MQFGSDEGAGSVADAPHARDAGRTHHTLRGSHVGVFTIVLNVPINNAVLASDRAALPADRETTRTPWNTLNAIRTPINYLSFLLMI